MLRKLWRHFFPPVRYVLLCKVRVDPSFGGGIRATRKDWEPGESRIVPAFESQVGWVAQWKMESWESWVLLRPGGIVEGGAEFFYAWYPHAGWPAEEIAGLRMAARLSALPFPWNDTHRLPESALPAA